MLGALPPPPQWLATHTTDSKRSRSSLVLAARACQHGCGLVVLLACLAALHLGAGRLSKRGAKSISEATSSGRWVAARSRVTLLYLWVKVRSSQTLSWSFLRPR